MMSVSIFCSLLWTYQLPKWLPKIGAASGLSSCTNSHEIKDILLKTKSIKVSSIANGKSIKETKITSSFESLFANIGKEVYFAKLNSDRVGIMCPTYLLLDTNTGLQIILNNSKQFFVTDRNSVVFLLTLPDEKLHDTIKSLLKIE